MHVVSLVFVGGGGCENLTEKLAVVGVVGLTSGGAPQRATNYSICKNLLLECTLGCPLHPARPGGAVVVPSLILDRPPGQAPPVSIILSTCITCAELASSSGSTTGRNPDQQPTPKYSNYRCHLLELYHHPRCSSLATPAGYIHP